ncbi:uncharacterized protein [Argopecten irradians]|uniref:uncharacterized protein n=1 Tax=Argopecten irradians TaxID=31199 RepID=UPI003711241C
MGLVVRVETVTDDLFGTTGLLACEPVSIKLKDHAVPYCVSSSSRIPFPLLEKVKTEPRRMKKDGIIERMTEPTDWCTSMVPVVKKVWNDLKKLNEAVKREHFMLPTLEDIAPRLAAAKVFSKLDASSGFYQVPLNTGSSRLTTFITPFGRFAFRRVPFGITSAPEIFQHKPTFVSADASSYGLGGALFQKDGDELKPVAFCSRTITTAESRYAQIEKECLASVRACEKFERYLMGLESFKLFTDHKPLAPLINNQDLDKILLRCQRLLMRLRRFTPIAEHVQGKLLVVPDTLSRSPLEISEVPSDEEVEINKSYLVVMNYHSRFLEIAHLSNITSGQAIGKLKNTFARFGVPEEPVSDNSRQFTANEFSTFAEKYNFVKTLTSPHYPQANGEAESGVKIAKRILEQDGIFLAAMAYRATPIASMGASPSQLIMGRQIRTPVPVFPKTLNPKWPSKKRIDQQDKSYKERHKAQYDRHNAVRTLPELEPVDTVKLKLDNQKLWSSQGIVEMTNRRRRTYKVRASQGVSWRNRRHLWLTRRGSKLFDVPK